MTPRILTPEEVAEIEARLKKATPGPWTIAVTQHGDELRNALYQEVVLEGNRRLKKMAAFNHDDIADAAFIASSPEDIANLIATLRQREAEIGRMREENSKLWGWVHELAQKRTTRAALNPAEEG